MMGNELSLYIIFMSEPCHDPFVSTGTTLFYVLNLNKKINILKIINKKTK